MSVARLLNCLETLCGELERELGDPSANHAPILSPLPLGSILEVCDGEQDFLQELVSDFLGELPSILQKLETNLAEGNLEQVRIIAHTLKGSCGSLGAMRLLEASRDLEAAARARDKASSGKAHGDLLDCVAATRIAMSRLQQPLGRVA